MGDFSKLTADSKISYWDIREISMATNQILVWNKNVKELSSGDKKGYNARALYNGAIGYAFSQNSKKHALERAISIAKALSRNVKKKKSLFTGKSVVLNKKSSFKINPKDISLDEKKKLLLELSKKEDELIKSTQLLYSDINKKVFFENSEGSRMKQDLTYTYFGASLVARKGTTQTFDLRKGAMAGYELTRYFPKLLKDAKAKVLELLDAKTIKGGLMPVVADPALTDVFIHEALGHSAEADIVLQKDSCIEGKTGKKIAPRNITVYDSSLGNNWGSYFFDDEGILAQKTPIIENGVLKTYLNSRETSTEFGQKPTSNSRMQDPYSILQVRMSNTYLKKGDHSFDELFQGIKKGVYLKGSRGGQVNTSNGSFLFHAQTGYLIENGKITKPLREVSLGGSTLEILNNIKRISKNYGEGFPGYCGKGGQYVQVEGNNPTILISNALVGGK